LREQANGNAAIFTNSSGWPSSSILAKRVQNDFKGEDPIMIKEIGLFRQLLHRF